MTVSGRDDLQQWLERQPENVCVALSYRASLRVLPFAITFDQGDPNATTLALISLRAAIAAGVVAHNPTNKNRAAARLAKHSLNHFDFPTSKAIEAIASSAQCAGDDDLSAAFDAIAMVGFAMSLMTLGGAKRRDRAIREICSDSALSGVELSSSEVSFGVTFRLAQKTRAEARQHLVCPFSMGGPWTFWANWYERAMAGNPLPWDLQEQIALIPDEIWEAGPEAVAEEIARIEAAFELRERIAEVEADQANKAEKRLGIGGNNPPEEIRDPETAQQVLILWESIAGLKEEVEADQPDAERVAALIERLGAALRAVIAWCGRKGDLIVDTSIKWGVPAATGGYFFVNPAKAEAVLKAAQAWLPFLAP